MRILLASNSPRRRELITGLDIPVEIVKLKDIEKHILRNFRQEKFRCI